MVGGGGWRPTLGEWAWCHCRVPFQCAMSNFGEVDVVALLLIAVAGCQSLFHMFLVFSGPPISPWHPRQRQWILSWASCRRHTLPYTDNTKIGFCYLGLCGKFFCLPFAQRTWLPPMLQGFVKLFVTMLQCRSLRRRKWRRWWDWDLGNALSLNWCMQVTF